jgi:8-oxo-dGTP pyrophosphatase MutT (NUDIX family)
MIEQYPEIIQSLSKSIKNEGVLFGEMADAAMPFKRLSSADAIQEGASIRHASVLLLLVPQNGKWCLVLMKRAEYPGVHSGQISIPGGEFEATDANARETALREFNEEMGVALNGKQIFAQLTKRYIPTSQFIVKPFLAYLTRMPNWKIDKKEVADLLIVPVEHLLSNDALRKTEIQIDAGSAIVLPAYHYEEHIIWGATAIMLTEFAAAWKSTFSDPVASVAV